jgi:hypothetical protein
MHLVLPTTSNMARDMCVLLVCLLLPQLLQFCKQLLQFCKQLLQLPFKHSNACTLLCNNLRHVLCMLSVRPLLLAAAAAAADLQAQQCMHPAMHNLPLGT